MLDDVSFFVKKDKALGLYTFKWAMTESVQLCRS